MRFKDSVEIEFPQNQVTLIAGENGAGKTSILDAVCLCLYGKTFRTSGRATSGYMGINDLVNHDSTKAVIRVEFENHGHNYVVIRDITRNDTDGEIFEDGESKAIGKRVYDYVRSRAIGLDWEGFRKSTIVLQGEMSSLTELDPSKRKDAFVKLFGLDRYLDYESLAKKKAKEKQTTIQAIEEVNKLLSAEAAKIPEVKREILSLTKSIASLEKRKLNLGKRVEQKKTEKDSLESDYTHYVKLQSKLAGIVKQINDVKKAVMKSRQELTRLTKLKKEFPRLNNLYKELSSLQANFDGLKPIKAKYDQYTKDISNLNINLRNKRGTHSDTLIQIRGTRSEIKNLKKQIPATRELRAVKMSLRKAENLEKKLERRKATLFSEIKQVNDSVKDMKVRMQQVKGKKTCPICFQKISDLQEILKHYLEENKTLATQKKSKADELVTVQRSLNTAQNEKERLTKAKETLEKRDAKKGELTREQSRLLTLRKSEKSLRLDTKALKGQIEKKDQEQKKLGFDHKLYKSLENRIGVFRKNKVTERFSTAKTELDRLPEVERDLKESESRLTSAKVEKSKVFGDVKSLGKIESRYNAAKKRLEGIQEEYNTNERNFATRLEKKKGSTQQLTDLKGKETELKTNLKNIKLFKQEIALLEDLRNIFKNIPENIIRRIRPFIEKEGTDIINDLSNNEITTLNIEEGTLNVAATMNGEIRPIHYFSGGQKTRINMALRVAVSRILSKLPQTEEHTFATMHTLFVDEGDFGNLDEIGIREAIAVVRNLTKEFNRVVLVSHVDAIREIFQGYTIEVIKRWMTESYLKTFGGINTQIVEAHQV